MRGDRDEVGVPVLHVDGHVRSGLARVDEHQRAGRVRGPRQRPDVVDRAEHVRHRGDREQLGAAQDFADRREVEAVVGGERDPAQLDATLLGQHQPGHDVGVVLHLAQHHHVALGQVLATPRVRDEVDGLGRVADEDDLLGLPGVEEPGDLGPRRLEGTRALVGDRVHAPVHVGVRRAVQRVHRVQHLDRLLRARRAVEVHEALPVDLALEDREVGLDRRDVDAHGYATCRKASKPSASTFRASSGPPDSTMRPSSRMCTKSGVRWSRIRW